MKTQSYNPSPLEVEIAQILQNLSESIGKQLRTGKIVSSDVNLNLDNPILHLEIMDSDGDNHHLTVKVIQKPDED
jgi:hypothetical protein